MAAVHSAADDVAEEFFAECSQQLVFRFKMPVERRTAYIRGVDNFLYRYFIVAFSCSEDAEGGKNSVSRFLLSSVHRYAP